MNRRRWFWTIPLLLAAAVLTGDEKSSARFIVRHNPPPRPVTAVPAPIAFRSTSELGFAGEALVQTYQAFVSPMDAPACPFSPTCSEYAKQAVGRYGLLRGMIMAADRYSRCHGLGARFYSRDPRTKRLVDPP